MTMTEDSFVLMKCFGNKTKAMLIHGQISPLECGFKRIEWD